MYVRAVGGGADVPPRSDHVLAAELQAFAVERNQDATIARIADALDARKSRVRRIFLDEGGEAFALTLVALTIDVEAATRIFLCHGQYVAMDAGKLRSLRALMSSTPMRAAGRIVTAINGVARPDRDPPRRSSWREDSNVHAGAWRRLGGGRLGPGVSQPLRQNQSA